MKNKIKIVLLGIIAVVISIIILTSIFPGAARVEASKEKNSQDIVDVSKIAFPADASMMRTGDEDFNPALESVLNRLLKIYKTEGSEAAAEFAAKRKIPFNNNQLVVTLEASPFKSSLYNNQEGIQNSAEAINRSVSMISSEIDRLGGQVQRSRHSVIRCNIGIQSLEELSQLPFVRSVRRALKPVKHAVTSEGVQKTGAHEYQALSPYKSNGAKVCVIDLGFEGYRDLLGSELPSSVVAQSFTEDGNLEVEGVHGTACAEIIHDMAPEAELYLANIFWDSDLIDAVNWAVQQKIDIISYSLGTYFGAGDGTGLDSSLARYAKESGGITWVTSAGNSGNDHWGGTFNDPDGDGWHNFYGEDELLSFYVPADAGIQDGVNAYLKWNDWGTWSDSLGYSGATQDYDLYLFIKIDGEWYLVDSSENRQPQFIWPWESIEGWYSLDDAEWGVAIHKNQANTNVYFDLYIPTHEANTVEYLVSAGSITSPADSPYVISVGAVDAVDDYLHYYSSQGPTTDGRIKPDICAPSWVSTSSTTYGTKSAGGGFAGTSAACPHVAGAIALLKIKTPFTTEEILDILYSRVIDMGVAGMDNMYGRGRLNLRR